MIPKVVAMAVMGSAGVAAYYRLAVGTRSEVKSFANVVGSYADAACRSINEVNEAEGDYNAVGGGADDPGCSDSKARVASVLDQLSRADSVGEKPNSGQVNDVNRGSK